jgi:hypothetical protein
MIRLLASLFQDDVTPSVVTEISPSRGERNHDAYLEDFVFLKVRLSPLEEEMSRM